MDILSLAVKEAGTPWLISFFEQIQTIEAIILVIGLLLLVLEIFIPGFGIAGGAGIAMLILGIFLTARTPTEAFLMFVVLVLLVAVLMMVILRSARKGQIARKIILKQSSSRDMGYRSAKDLSHLIGKTGVAVTSLRPAGTGQFGDSRLDVVTEGSFIDKGTRIQITQVQGNRIVVVPLAEASNI